jgi:hypothetical protein
MFKNRKNEKTYRIGDFPNAEYLGNRGLSLPTFTDWKKSKNIINQYIDAFKKVNNNFNELLNNSTKK